MSIAFSAVEIRHERRIRLVFTNSLASGAFVTGFYVVSNLDGLGTSPNVNGALVVSGAAANVELALSADLVAGALYQVSAIGVPAIDSSVTPGGSILQFRVPLPTSLLNVEPKVDDGDRLLYGQDIVWNGIDFLETSNGDLYVVSGVNNARLAVERRLLSEGLLWDPSYGAKPRQYVDAVASTVGNLKATLEQQAQADDRVKRVTAELVTDDSKPTQATFNVDVDLIGGQKLPTIGVDVQVN